MAQARRRSKIGLCWGWVLSLWGWRRSACSADELEARQPAYTWAAVQKRGAITLQKNSGLAGVITFLWRGLFSHDLNTSSSKSPYAVNRSGESSGCSASLLGTDTPFALTPDSQRIKRHLSSNNVETSYALYQSSHFHMASLPSQVFNLTSVWWYRQPLKYWDTMKVASSGPLDSPHAVQHTCCVPTNKHCARHGDAIHLCHLIHIDMLNI